MAKILRESTIATGTLTEETAGVPIDVRGGDHLSIQAVVTATGVADAAIRFDKSNDGVNWTEIAAETEITASGSFWLDQPTYDYNWVRVWFTLSDGTISSSLNILLKSIDF